MIWRQRECPAALELPQFPWCKKNAAEVLEQLSCWTSYLKFRNTERSVTHTSQLMTLLENDAMEDGSVYLKNVLP